MLAFWMLALNSYLNFYKKLVLYNNNASLKCQLFYTSYIFV